MLAKPNAAGIAGTMYGTKPSIHGSKTANRVGPPPLGSCVDSFWNPGPRGVCCACTVTFGCSCCHSAIRRSSTWNPGASSLPNIVSVMLPVVLGKPQRTHGVHRPRVPHVERIIAADHDVAVAYAVQQEPQGQGVVR